MKHRKVWQLLHTILLMGVMFAGCASAGTKTANHNGNASAPQKTGETSGAVKKNVTETKENREKGTAMPATNMKIKVVANGKENCICAERYFRIPLVLCAAAVIC